MPIAPKPRRQATRTGTDRKKPAYGHKWSKYSARRLAEHPLCEMECKRRGLTTAAVLTDHIVAVSGPDDPGFWDPANHQSGCRSCHDVKTQTEDRNAGRRKGNRVNVITGPQAAAESFVARTRSPGDIVINPHRLRLQLIGQSFRLPPEHQHVEAIVAKVIDGLLESLKAPRARLIAWIIEPDIDKALALSSRFQTGARFPSADGDADDKPRREWD